MKICACLQAALANEGIRTHAFKAWVAMIKNLDDSDVGPMLENTFSIILLRWEDFDETSRQDSRDLIKFLLTKSAGLLSDFVDVIPSLDQIEDLADVSKELENLRADLDQSKQYRLFSRRVAHEHASVVTQALSELAIYLRENQAFLQASAISEQPDKVVGELLRAIIDACVKFSSRSFEIARLSAECLGLIGCLDSNRVEDIRGRREIVVVSNFEDAGEVTDFVLFLLEEVLVKAFLSAPDPRAQGFLSYAMQELLEKCDFKAVCSDPPTSTNPTDPRHAIYEKWLSLPKTVQDTLTPFLRTKYTITAMIKAHATYPIFQPKKKLFTSWLRSFALDLLEQPNNNISRLVFPPLCRVIRIEDTSVASFLLPFIVLHAVASGTDKQREQIAHELLTILSYEAHEASHEELATLQSCSEVWVSLLVKC
jgi:serine/threonine-protein kinase ATR